MHAYQGNICDPSDPNPAALAGPEFTGFDVAAVGLGFHHFDDPTLAARRLGERLKTGGVLMILDFLPHDKPDVSPFSPSPFPSFISSYRSSHPFSYSEIQQPPFPSLAHHEWGMSVTWGEERKRLTKRM